MFSLLMTFYLVCFSMIIIDVFVFGVEPSQSKITFLLIGALSGHVTNALFEVFND